MCTDAIFDIAILSSLLPNNRDFTRDTRCGLITSLVGNKKFPCVHREAVKVSAGEESIGLSAASDIGERQQLPNYQITQLQNVYTHSNAPFFQTQMYPTIRMAKKITISSRPNSPNALNFTAHGNKKIVSTSNTTNRMAMM
jgi:hypothetical protein